MNHVWPRSVACPTRPAWSGRSKAIVPSRSSPRSWPCGCWPSRATRRWCPCTRTSCGRIETARDEAKQNVQRAEQSQQETAKALAAVESQKAEVVGSLSKAEAAERLARAAEEAGR